MRGTGGWHSIPRACVWITPARAGNRNDRHLFITAAGDHPRACGEQVFELVCGGFVRGSPPRVRGTDQRERPIRPGAGITPARAGNRAPSPWPSAWAWDHPRACGEQDIRSSLASNLIGSPPRVRGTVLKRRNPKNEKRITPARAGNSGGGSQQNGGQTDHPRACGEQLQHRWRRFYLLGSPPRVRGTVHASLI
mgnify:CR=1 FL=1